jgi:hypothetical protein
MSELADRLRSAFQCACDSDACQDTRVDAAARLESLEAQRRVLREACDSALNSGLLRFGQDALSMSIRTKLHNALAATEDKP